MKIGQPLATAEGAIEARSLVGPLIGEERSEMRYLAAIVLVCAVAGIRYALIPVLGTQAPLLPLLLAVWGAVWLGGLSPAVLATIISLPLATALFTDWPHGTRYLEWTGHLALFSVAAVLVSFVGHRFQRLHRGQHDALVVAQSAERRAVESEAQLRLITDNLPALISYIDRDGRYRFANAAYAVWFESDQANVVGRSARELMGEEMWRLREPYFNRVLAGELVQYEAPIMHRSLGLRDCAIEYVPDRSADGTVAGFYVMVHDITERKLSERALREQERMLKLIYDNSSDGLVLIAVEDDERFRVVSVNETCLAVCGCAREQAEGHLVEDVLPTASRARALTKLQQAVSSKRPLVYYETVALPAGRRHGEVTLIPIATPERGVTHLLAAVKDVTEKKQAEEALFEANRRKDEFLAMLAHELRNPLAAIRNVGHVLGNEGIDLPAIRRSSELLQRQATQLSRLVDDLLDVARITRGAIELKRELKRLDELIDAALEAVQPLFAVKRQTVNVMRALEPLWVMGDAVRLTQVFTNLLGNAAKYSPDRSVIDLRIEHSGHSAVVRLRDPGVGIDAQMLPRVFDLFAQADQSLDRSQGGLGVGLTIVKSLVEMHAGQVEAHSSGIGMGSEFVVRLPLAEAVEARSAAPGTKESKQIRRRILVVEDNADAAQSLAMLLEMAGHYVQIAGDGPAALASLERFDAEIVLLDIGLPGADGYVVAQAIRERFAAPLRKLYALTGYGREEDRTLALSAGFDGHLTKPVDPANLLGLIDDAPARDATSKFA
jgi:PAS domain S-box-containing protein